MKIYYVVGSPNCRKVHAAANHLGITLEFEYLDFFANETNQPAYLRINPNGMVPTLGDGEFLLWESNAIMQYLADTIPGNSLFPTDARTRADIVRWQCWELAHYNKAFSVLSLESVVKPNFFGAAPDQTLVQWAVNELALFASVLETHLNARSYLVGENVTLADYSMIHLEMFRNAVPFDWSPYPNLNDYYERMRAIPHWADTAPASPEAMGRRPQDAPAPA